MWFSSHPFSPHLDYTPKCFLEDLGAHLAFTGNTIGEGDSNFFEFEAHFPGGVFHFDLKGITNKSDIVEIDGFELFQKLWTEDEVTYHGDHVSIDRVRLTPKPVQDPHIPIIVGGYSKAAFDRAARFGAGWYGFNTDPAATAGALAQLDESLAAAGRKRGDDFEIVITPPYKCDADMVKAYGDIGVDRVVVQLGGQRPDQIERRFDFLADLVALEV